MWSADNAVSRRRKTLTESSQEQSQSHPPATLASKEHMQMWFRELQDKFMTTVQDQFNTMREDMKQAVQELQVDVAKLEERTDMLERIVQNAEEEAQQHSETQEHLVRLTHNVELQCEDLENRSRRSNIRIENMVEAGEDKDLKMAVQVVFRDILAMEEAEYIKIDRVHRVGPRRKGEPGERPRDVLVAMSSYPQKQQILRKARGMDHIRMNGVEIQLFQDLALVTLQKRRAMGPVVKELVSRKIRYKWTFPFGLLFS
ncbi:tropomyosin-like [Ambystoma mexicanum]|uniref:tropomyosin-like n=1 Tax=Ambystoma mexicanum TaxID=8296 RepID=UPI0037E74C74